VAAVLTAVAAKVAGWPGGGHVLRAGRWTRGRVVLYLDGPRPETLSAPALRWRRARRTGYAGLGLMVGAPIFALLVGWLFLPVPNADDAVESQLNTVSFADGSVLARIAPNKQGNRQKVDLAQVPPSVRFAVLSAEDRTFYSNSGFDVVGFGRAVWKNLTGGSGGGSTITQQYVKNAMVGDEYSLVRKYKELIISLKISEERSKDQILGDYLNSIYFGRGAYGIQAASQAYFGRSVETLTPSEGALLAGIIQSPSRWDPAVRPDDSVRRWNYVMDGMVAQGWLPAPARASAPYPVALPPRRVTSGVPDDDRGHIYSAVRDELRSHGIDEDALVTDGLQIQTTIQPRAQREAGDAVRRQMSGQPDNLRNAMVSIDPRSGAVLAYYGGANGSGLDYARVEKQAGSTFKPFVLLAGLQQNPPIGISTEFDGQSVNGRTVRNVDGADCDRCSLKRAMTLSNNVVYTALGNRVGPQAVAAAARQAGITQAMAQPDNGIALGNEETTPVDLASAYATLANDGVYFAPHLVERVTTASGEVLYDHATEQGEQRIDPVVARNVTEAMRDVPDYDGVQLSGGRDAAGKTGTVQGSEENQNNDAWMAGYTPQASTVVWVGTDDNTPIMTSDRRPVYGHGLPSEIWKTFMDDALQNAPRQSFGAFTPVAGTDPGDTSRRGADAGDSAPTSSRAPTSSAARTTTAAPTEPDAPPTAADPPVEPAVPADQNDPAADPAAGGAAAN
jgi:membrane peptidoglycan carboxypeptidase